MRRWPTLVGLACLLGLTNASAQDVSVAPQTSVKPHPAKAKAARPAPMKAASLGDIPFSDPYGPPVGSHRLKGAATLTSEDTVPVEPQGGFTLKAGRDSPDAPMTGGLMFRF